MRSDVDGKRIACFISAHGYGHAARASAVMETLCILDPSIRFELFTTVPRPFFSQSLSSDFGYHPLSTDVGLVQLTPMRMDLDETLNRLNGFLPLDPSIIRDTAVRVAEKKCRLVLCDIAPMGIRVAQEAGIPSVLVENFTWDWVYGEYLQENERLAGHANYLEGLFGEADFHVQTEPVCRAQDVDLTTFPVSRKNRTPAPVIRKKLGVPKDTKLVLITMGGVPDRYPFLDKLKDFRDVHFVLTGPWDRVEIQGNVSRLPHHSRFYHPDLVHASDAVIGKAGYGTLSEIYSAGVAFGYVARKNFRESEVLVSYVETHMSGLPIAEEAFYDGRWLSGLRDLFSIARIERTAPDGAEQVARFLNDLL